jgi:hypothetical protein
MMQCVMSAPPAIAFEGHWVYHKGVHGRDETLIYLHLPKTAGMTLHRILERRYPRAQTYTFDGKRPRRDVERFQALPIEQRARFRLLKGHVVFGLHQAVPGAATYMTLLRDPVERVISQYYYAKSQPNHYLYVRLNRDGVDLFEYAARRMTPELSNQQTSMLGGPRGTSREKSPTRETLDRAMENLRTHFCVVGLTEEFDASLLLMQRTFGWRTPFYQRENVTGSKPPGAEIDPRARELLTELNQLDLELYAFARARFEADWRAIGEQREAQLGRFRAWNQRYQRLVTPLKRWRAALTRLDSLAHLNTIRA